jgi:hypothetical protein
MVALADISGVPLNDNWLWSNSTHVGTSALTLASWSSTTGIPSRLRKDRNDADRKGTPEEMLTVWDAVENPSTRRLTTMLKSIAASANPGTFDAISLRSYVWGPAKEETSAGVVPENDSSDPSNCTHGGRGVLFAETA